MAQAKSSDSEDCEQEGLQTNMSLLLRGLECKQAVKHMLRNLDAHEPATTVLEMPSSSFAFVSAGLEHLA